MEGFNLRLPSVKLLIIIWEGKCNVKGCVMKTNSEKE
jgi:hypothetical protein